MRKEKQLSAGVEILYFLSALVGFVVGMERVEIYDQLSRVSWALTLIVLRIPGKHCWNIFGIFVF